MKLMMDEIEGMGGYAESYLQQNMNATAFDDMMDYLMSRAFGTTEDGESFIFHQDFVNWGDQYSGDIWK